MKSILAIAAAGGLGVAASAFAGFDQVITFDEVPLGTNANGMVIGNVEFSFGFPGRGFGSDATVNGGPGVTPYTSDPGIEGPTGGTLGLRFLKPVSAFGFGCAFLAQGFIHNALSVSLYDTEGQFITKLTADADSEVLRGEIVFSAGFLLASGHGSIGSADVDFADFQEYPDVRGKPEIDRFLFDNLGYDIKDRIVPLPTPAFMGGAGLIGVAAIRRRREV